MGGGSLGPNENLTKDQARVRGTLSTKVMGRNEPTRQSITAAAYGANAPNGYQNNQ